jgi:predicted enzyme related to lactoylglutathione lyase
MLIKKILNHISIWGKVWFGFIFLGSVFNATFEKISLLSDMPYISVFAFGSGALIGFLAKMRGAWL